MKKILLAFGIVLLSGSLAFGMPILHGTQISISDFTSEWYADDPEGRQARALITTSTNSFQIVLMNEATQTTNPPDVLVGIFFGTIDGAFSVLATGVAGTPLSNDPSFDATYGDNLSGEWGFLADIDGINGSLGEYGVSSSAFDPESGAPAGWDGFGYTTLIDSGVAYNSPNSPNGIDFGIMTGDPSLFVSSMNPYILNQVTIYFSGSITPGMIDEVHFLYGTDYKVAVPEPSTMLLLGSGLIGLAAFRKKFKK